MCTVQEKVVRRRYVGVAGFRPYSGPALPKISMMCFGLALGPGRQPRLGVRHPPPTIFFFFIFPLLYDLVKSGDSGTGPNVNFEDSVTILYVPARTRV
jgi:hypothetical protein